MKVLIKGFYNIGGNVNIYSNLSFKWPTFVENVTYTMWVKQTVPIQKMPHGSSISKYIGI